MGEKSQNHPSGWRSTERSSEAGLNGGGKLPFMPEVTPVVAEYDIERLMPLQITGRALFDFHKLFMQEKNRREMSRREARYNLEAATKNRYGMVVVAYDQSRILGTATGTLHQQDVGWVEDYMVDDNAEERRAAVPLFHELHEWFNRMGVKQVNLAVDDERTPGIFAELGYKRDYNATVFEKPLLHMTEWNQNEPRQYYGTKAVVINEAVGEAEVQYLPSGTKSWIIPPDPVAYAGRVMRRLESWLGSKDADVARYVARHDSMPYMGYEPINTRIYRHDIE